MKNIKFIFIQFIICILLIELIAFLSIEIFHFNANIQIVYPTYFKTKRNAQPVSNYFVYDINNDFGVWHPKQDSFVHHMSCFDVTYYFNSYGARDFERDKKSNENRILFIGDSFIEGLGVDSSKRLSNLIQSETSIDCLNFGTSGDFGSTQISLLYQKFASQFDHNQLVIGIYPNNDFADDDIETGKLIHKDRYRPYYIPEQDTIIYYLDSLKKSKWYPLNTYFSKVKIYNIGSDSLFYSKEYASINLIYKILMHSYSYHLLKRLTIEQEFKKIQNERKSIYNSYTNRQITILKNSLVRIKNTAKTRGVKKILLCVFPNRIDFIELLKEGKKMRLQSELETLSNDLNFEYIDLLSEFSVKDYQKLYLECDSHFSEYGHLKTADILKKHIIKN